MHGLKQNARPAPLNAGKALEKMLVQNGFWRGPVGPALALRG